MSNKLMSFLEKLVEEYQLFWVSFAVFCLSQIYKNDPMSIRWRMGVDPPPGEWRSYLDFVIVGSFVLLFLSAFQIFSRKQFGKISKFAAGVTLLGILIFIAQPRTIHDFKVETRSQWTHVDLVGSSRIIYPKAFRVGADKPVIQYANLENQTIRVVQQNDSNETVTLLMGVESGGSKIEGFIKSPEPENVKVKIEDKEITRLKKETIEGGYIQYFEW